MTNCRTSFRRDYARVNHPNLDRKRRFVSLPMERE